MLNNKSLVGKNKTGFGERATDLIYSQFVIS